MAKPRDGDKPKRPATVDEYIEDAPPEGQPHLRRLREILTEVAPHAEQTIKWNTPFFVEPRYLFAFSAHKAHVSFAPTARVLELFSEELEGHSTSRELLKIPYDQPLPEDLIRRMAEHRAMEVSERQDDSFW